VNWKESIAVSVRSAFLVFLSIFAAKQGEVSKKTPRLKNKLKTSF
jgi:hypothetical protein